MDIYSIGFTKTTAEHFFERLRDSRVRRLLDVRRNPGSQLSGFAKGRDLPFFLRELVGAEYEYEPILAPTDEILAAYKRRNEMAWSEYEAAYLRLLAERQVEKKLRRASFATATALLCSEATADHCHRRLALEYLSRHWDDTRIIHL